MLLEQVQVLLLGIYYSMITLMLMIHRPASPQTSTIVQLPSGAISLFVNIIDAMGATATYQIPVIQVSAPAVADAAAAASLASQVIQQQLQSATAVGNAAAVSQIVTATSAVLNQVGDSASSGMRIRNYSVRSFR